MILIDSLFINNGGGKILLDYLVNEIENNKLKVFYIFDERCKNSYLEIPSNRKIYLKPSFLERYKFYNKNKSTFNKVVCFGNLPPNIRLKAEVYTYFHQLIYISIPKEFSFFQKIKFNLKIGVLKLIAKNTDYWLVQSNHIKEELHKKFLFKHKNIKVLPFYPQFGVIKEPIREKLTYLYVSNANPHKNHSRLIEVFCNFYNVYKKGTLIVTVNENYQTILNLIETKQKLGYPIKNIGFVERAELHKEFLSSEFLIYPSTSESFGLGLIEAIECGCKVIAADLPYTYEVCEPSLIFNPFNNESILNAFEKSMNENIKMSIPKITNNINELINILQNYPCN